MIKQKCSLCGGRLADGRCTLCGLDNSVYERECPRRTAISAVEDTGGEKKTEKGRRGNNVRQSAAAVGKKKNSAGRGSRIIAFTVLAVVLLSFLPSIIDAVESVLRNIQPESGFTDIYEDDTYIDYSSEDYQQYFSDGGAYADVTREIPEDGDDYEVVLGNGIYRTGVHIPEGVYRAELVEGAGTVNITDKENSIYETVYFGADEEYGQTASLDNIRLYNDSDLKIESGVIVKFTTENAQPPVQEILENPLKKALTLTPDTYRAGDGVLPEGVYDISARSVEEDTFGYTSIILNYPNGEVQNFWADGPEFAVTSDEYSDRNIRNVVIPAGTDVSVTYGDAVFIPGEGYYDVDYSEYE